MSFMNFIKLEIFAIPQTKKQTKVGLMLTWSLKPNPFTCCVQNMMQFNCYNYFLPIQHFFVQLRPFHSSVWFDASKNDSCQKTHITNIGNLSFWLNHYEILYIVMVFGIRLSIFVMLNFI